MSETVYQSFPFKDFELSFKTRYNVARDGERLLIKMADAEVPYADGRGTFLVEFRKWITERKLEFFWSKEMVISAQMWVVAGCKQIDRSVPVAEHVAARRPLVQPSPVAPKSPDRRVTGPPLRPIPPPKAVSR